MAARRLSQRDYAAFEDYLIPQTETAMFLRSNAHRKGLDHYSGERYQAIYFGVFNGDALEGVLSLNSNGNIFCQADMPAVVERLLERARVDAPDFTVKGVLAPDWQTDLIVTRLQRPAADVQVEKIEDVFKLALVELLRSLGQGRPAAADDIPLLTDWKLAYETEVFNRVPDEAYRIAAVAEVTRHVQHGDIFLAVDAEGTSVAKAAFNARLPDSVQIGGAYTPPALRNCGYGRAAVAAALRSAQVEGVATASLFTGDPAAQRAFQGLGFQPCGRYRSTIFKTSARLG